MCFEHSTSSALLRTAACIRLTTSLYLVGCCTPASDVASRQRLQLCILRVLINSPYRVKDLYQSVVNPSSYSYTERSFPFTWSDMWRWYIQSYWRKTFFEYHCMFSRTFWHSQHMSHWLCNVFWSAVRLHHVHLVEWWWSWWWWCGESKMFTVIRFRKLGFYLHTQ